MNAIVDASIMMALIEVCILIPGISILESVGARTYKYWNKSKKNCGAYGGNDCRTT